MAIMFRIAPAVIFSIVFLFPAFGQSLGFSQWVEGLHSRARLISGGAYEDRLLAGIEMALDPGFKTYWRNPGESGLPPRFDWSGSENVAAIDIRWPAPSRTEDAADIAYVYNQGVVLPVLVKPEDPNKPVRLALSLDYGICKDICIPARASMSATLTREGPQRAALEEALAAVPRPQALGAKGDLSIVAVEPLGGDKPGFRAVVRAPAGHRPVLFAEGPDDWYLSTSPADDANRFTVTVEDKPKDASGPVPVRLTLVAGGQAIEAEVSLDGGNRPR
jgi:DsbC/DsbD-like thiol-disulfide interchange protein